MFSWGRPVAVAIVSGFAAVAGHSQFTRKLKRRTRACKPLQLNPPADLLGRSRTSAARRVDWGSSFDLCFEYVYDMEERKLELD